MVRRRTPDKEIASSVGGGGAAPGLKPCRFAFTQPPRLLTTVACGGLRSTPDCRPRRTYLHLSYSYAAPCGPALLVTQDPLRTSGISRDAKRPETNRA